MSWGIHSEFYLAKKNAGDMALFHQMIGDIYWKKTDTIWQCCVCEVLVHNGAFPKTWKHKNIWVFYIKIHLFNPKLTLFCVILHIDISDIQPPPLVVHRYVGAYPWHIAMNRLIGWKHKNIWYLTLHMLKNMSLVWAFCSHTSTFSFSVFTYIYYFDHF